MAGAEPTASSRRLRSGYVYEESQPLLKSPVLRLRDCPNFLARLLGPDADSFVIVRQHYHKEVFDSYRASLKKYIIKTVQGLGTDIFFAVEVADDENYYRCGVVAPYPVTVMNENSRDVMYFRKSRGCMSCWFPCCLQMLEVQQGPSNDRKVLGYVKQKWSVCCPRFDVSDASGTTKLKICGSSCFAKNQDKFKIFSADDQEQVGEIVKYHADAFGQEQEPITQDQMCDKVTHKKEESVFKIQLTRSLHPIMKAVCMGAGFLIDVMYFRRIA